MRRVRLLLPLTSACVLTLVLALGACDVPMGGDEFDPPAAEIVDVRVEPDPVVVGDTATFTCVVERNVPGLEFWWSIHRTAAATDTNQYSWVASSPPGQYRVTVQVNRTPGAFEPVQSGTSFTVIEQD